MPKVSVLIPAFNVEQFIGEAIESILQQTFTDFELLVLDDGSTDHTWEEIQKFSDPRIKLLRNEQNQGIPFSRNKLMENAEGEYWAWLDADDIALPNRLEIQVRFMDKNPEVGICGSWYETFGNQSKIIKPPTLGSEIKCLNLFNPCIKQSSAILRSSVLKKYQLSYPLSLEVSQDYAMEVLIGNFSQQANIPQILVTIRDHIQRISYQKTLQQIYNLRCTQQIMLTKIGIEATEDDFKLHFQLVNSFDELTSIETLYKIDNWLTKIKKANDIYAVFPEPQFTDILKKIWFKNMAGYSKLGLNFWRIFTKSVLSPYRNQFNKWKKLKLFIHCILAK